MSKNKTNYGTGIKDGPGILVPILISPEDARHAKECVNACAGIDDPQTTVPELVNQLRHYQRSQPSQYGVLPDREIDALLAKCAGVPE